MSHDPRHFLTGAELTAAELDALLDRATELKAAPLSSRALEGRGVALIFEKPSTRTRLSFEMGVHELGGHPLVLRSGEMQLSRGESPRDTALVLSRQVAAVGMRTGPDALLEELAAHAEIPVFNMLTALHHPCQALADLMTAREEFGALAGLRLAYVGDGTNVARSLAILGALAGMDVAIASPEGYALEDDLSLPPGAEGSLTLYHDPREAASGAHVLYTDVWVSMGDEDTADGAPRGARPLPHRRRAARRRRAGAMALHCLPAHPGEEITAEVLYGPRQRIWEQAENRRHAQKALLELLVEPAPYDGAWPRGREARRQRPRRRRSDADGAPALPKRPERGEEIELRIDSLAHGGEGVGRLGDGGYVVFVSGALPGDRVKAAGGEAQAQLCPCASGGDPGGESGAHPADGRASRGGLAGAPLRAPAPDQARAGGGRAAAHRQARRLRAARRSSPRSSSGATATSSSTRSDARRRWRRWCAASTPPAVGSGWTRSRTACWRPSGATWPAR